MQGQLISVQPLMICPIGGMGVDELKRITSIDFSSRHAALNITVTFSGAVLGHGVVNITGLPEIRPSPPPSQPPPSPSPPPPAKDSCADIKKANPSATDGVYTIGFKTVSGKLNMIDTECHFESTSSPGIAGVYGQMAYTKVCCPCAGRKYSRTRQLLPGLAEGCAGG